MTARRGLAHDDPCSARAYVPRASNRTPGADFWVVSAGSGVLLILLALVLHWRGDRELSAADVLLGELHLGATYEAIVRRRLWRRMPVDVLAIPLAILAATYLLVLHDG